LKGRAAAPPASTLQHRRLDLDESTRVHIPADRRDDAAAAPKAFARFVTRHKVQVALPILQFDVDDTAPLLRGRLQRLCEHDQPTRLKGWFARSSAKHSPRNLNEVAQVELANNGELLPSEDLLFAIDL